VPQATGCPLGSSLECSVEYNHQSISLFVLTLAKEKKVTISMKILKVKI